MKKSKRARATDFSLEVKERIWERDGGRCVVCGNTYLAFPEAHYISRTNGGLGIEENGVTLCRFPCHNKFDQGTREERARIRAAVKAYLQSKYPDWDESKLIYKKYGD